MNEFVWGVRRYRFNFETLNEKKTMLTHYTVVSHTKGMRKDNRHRSFINTCRGLLSSDSMCSLLSTTERIFSLVRIPRFMSLLKVSAKHLLLTLIFTLLFGPIYRLLPVRLSRVRLLSVRSACHSPHPRRSCVPTIKGYGLVKVRPREFLRRRCQDIMLMTNIPV